VPSDGCVFCAIAEGLAPAQRVHEDEHTLAFMDLFPVAEGHTLIATRGHYENVFEAPEEALAAVGRASVPLARAVRDAFRPDGISVYQANGVAAGQTVFHYHMHLIPRHDGVPLRLHGREMASEGTLAGHAERIRKALAGARGGPREA